MTLRPALAALLLAPLAACPGPLESGADAGRTDAGAGLADASIAPLGDAASLAGADGSAAEPPDAAAAALGVISVADLWAVLSATPDGGDKGFLLVNVHVPDEGNIPGTDANLAYTDPDAIAAYLGSDLDRRAVVYCRLGAQSTTAGEALVARGYRAIRQLEGGFTAWKNAGHPMDP